MNGSRNRETEADPVEILGRSIEAAGMAVYHWDIASDRLTWSRNAADILEVEDPERLRTGRAYATLLDRENMASRYDTIMHSVHSDDGEGVTYSIEYLVRPWGPEDPRGAWLEDIGRWYADEKGRPKEAFGVVRRIDERYRNEQRLHYLGNFDPLTGLMNRASMGEALDQAIANAERHGTSCAFLAVSIDNMSVIRDAYGFDVAEEVILKVGRRLKQVKRTGDSLARYSETRFGIILNDCSREDLQIAADRFLGVANEEVIETSSGPVWALISLGGVVMPDHARDRDAAVACAEEALAEAASRPMSCVVIYEPEPDRISQRMLNARCAAEIVNSLKHDRFTLAFQPIVDAHSEKPVMYESLLRMHDRDGEIVAAAHLIPLAEKLGLVRLIDLNVMELVLETLRNHADARLTMNLSGITAADPGWFGRIMDLLEVNSSVTDRLVVEITETVVLNELAEIGRFIGRLRDLGCKVAIDDFGAGYTSFRNLKELDVDIVKLDGAFCDNLSGNPDNQYFVRSLVDLAHNLDLKIVAEWVQTEEDAELLRGWGVDYFQGRLYGSARIGHPWPSPRLSSHEGFHAVGAEKAKPEEEGRGEDAGVVLPAPERTFGKRRRDVARDMEPEVENEVRASAADAEAEAAGAVVAMDAGTSAEMPESAAGTAGGGPVMRPEEPVEPAADGAADVAPASTGPALSGAEASEGGNADGGPEDRDASCGASAASIGEALSTLERELQDLRQLLAAMRGVSGKDARTAEEASEEAGRVRGNG